MSTSIRRRQVAGVASLAFAASLAITAFAGQAHAEEGSPPAVTEAESPDTQPPTTETPDTAAPPTEEPTTEAPPTEVAHRARLDYSCESKGVARWRVTNPADVAGEFRAIRVEGSEVLWIGTIAGGDTAKFTAAASEGTANTVVVQRGSSNGKWVSAGPNAQQNEGDEPCEPVTEVTPTTPAEVTPTTPAEVTPTTPAPAVVTDDATTAAPAAATEAAELPSTGRATGGLVAVGLAAVGTGGALLLVRRRGTPA